ncbi:MAG: hypothetical protein KF878_17560 [Planctomycetes bacterium]|nr:hypothetical protein [Planctomycetota bacterium]
MRSERPEGAGALRWTGAPRSRADVAVYGVVAALIVLALAGPPLAGALDPRLPVSVVYHEVKLISTIGSEPRRDPWGTSFIHTADGRVWSLGPNRLDDGGRGDDILVLDDRSAWLQLYTGGAEGLFGLAVLLALLWELLRALSERLRAPRGPLPAEAGQAAALALLVAPVVGVGLLIVSHLLPGQALTDLGEALRGAMLVPWELALAATVYLLTAAVLLGIRLRAPEAAESAGDGGQS